MLPRLFIVNSLGQEIISPDHQQAIHATGNTSQPEARLLSVFLYNLQVTDSTDSLANSGTHSLAIRYNFSKTTYLNTYLFLLDQISTLKPPPSLLSLNPFFFNL